VIESLYCGPVYLINPRLDQLKWGLTHSAPSFISANIAVLHSSTSACNIAVYEILAQIALQPPSGGFFVA
jgi:hypothetical protein